MTESITLKDDKKLIFRVVAGLSDGRNRIDICKDACIFLDEKHGMNVATSSHWNNFLCEALDKYAGE